MAEGGSPPLRDPGGLHVYNMNGSSHKMAELVMGDSPGNHNSTINCQDRSNIEHFSGENNMYQPESSIQQTAHSSNYLMIEPLNYQEPGVFEELKRPSPPMQQLQYYTSMESAPMFDSYKGDPGNHAAMSGYIDMLGNQDSVVTIKKEKIDYGDTMGLANSSNSSDIPYPPNSCVPDWNFYNSVSGNGHFPNQGNVQGVFGYQGQQNQQSFPSNMMFNNTQPIDSRFQSNDEIHFQSQKITQSILSSEWGPETLYKSHLYSNLAMDSTNRKRRSESEKSKGSKAKRKKSASDLGGHSKMVASILLSENSTSTSNLAHCSTSDSILDSTARNTLVSILMDNIRSTVQFESFCLSFPRSDVKENGFRHKVSATVNLVQNLPSYVVKSQPFPLNFVMGATKVLSNFKNALKNTMTSIPPSFDVDNDLDNINLSMEQVEEHLPHSMVWVVKLGDNILAANWEGQMVIGINPVQKVLSVCVFQFKPNFSTEGINCLQQNKLTKDLADDIKRNMEQFEVSRQLRCDINLKKVSQLYLHRENGETNEGCLILELTENPQFYQRWLHTSAEDKNKWRQRQNFFTKAPTSGNEVLYIGGLVSELNELVALILASDKDFVSLYEEGVSTAFVHDSKASSSTNHDINDRSINNAESHYAAKKLSKNKKFFRKLGSNVNKLRQEIVEVLVHQNIVEQDKVENILANASSKGDKDGSSEISLGITIDNACACFQDYINYSCDSATELNTILEKVLCPRVYGFYENDFDLSKVPDENIDKLKIGQLISCNCSEHVYYSFCKKEAGQIGYDSHCSKCHICRATQFWHCDTCNQCTESRSVCVYCGHLRNDQSRCVVKPYSVFKSQVSSAQVVSVDDIKQEWISSLVQTEDDVLTLSLLDVDTNCTNMEEYNSQNAMVDQLGLLNPVGFLLGQPNVAASRKYRRYKGGQLHDIVPQPKGKGAQSSGSGCSVQ